MGPCEIIQADIDGVNMWLKDWKLGDFDTKKLSWRQWGISLSKATQEFSNPSVSRQKKCSNQWQSMCILEMTMKF